ncbi:hypothetical protein OAN307_c16680 [Octadecabacter antarcticus 307]|uniref:Uncharacterized protein n=1 Tax=Octadecabacter antarcticus 307 TaxID=391626 RepID=M9RAF3_9RHOB|nr:hypothetical protein OAN307_c16680 [Octadecabacter antarcticus 307]
MNRPKTPEKPFQKEMHSKAVDLAYNAKAKCTLKSTAKQRSLRCSLWRRQTQPSAMFAAPSIIIDAL